MYLKNLELTNFRNFEHLRYECGSGINCIIGDNGQGKTSIVEAIYYLAGLRSMRKASDREMIRHGAGQGFIRSIIDNGGQEFSVGIELNLLGSKKVKKDNKFVRSHKEYWGTLRSVVFSSNDMELVRGGPGGRRDYLDHTLMMLDPAYLSDITDYGKCLSQKNSLLKQLQDSRSEYLEAELELWNNKLSELMHRIYLSRHAIIDKMSGVIGRIYGDFFSESAKVGIVYQSQVDGLSEGELLAKLSSGTAKEIIVGHSLTGIHRDDMLISLNGHDARVVASQGQQRIITIALKLAQIEILREKFGNNFILILDDVMAELDNMRQSVIYHIIPADIQTFITTTHIDDIELLRLRLDHIDSYTLSNGILTRG